MGLSAGAVVLYGAIFTKNEVKENWSKLTDDLDSPLFARHTENGEYVFGIEVSDYLAEEDYYDYRVISKFETPSEEVEIKYSEEVGDFVKWKPSCRPAGLFLFIDVM